MCVYVLRFKHSLTAQYIKLKYIKKKGCYNISQMQHEANAFGALGDDIECKLNIKLDACMFNFVNEM